MFCFMKQSIEYIYMMTTSKCAVNVIIGDGEGQA